MPQHELEARIDAVDAQLVRDTCYKYIYDRWVYFIITVEARGGGSGLCDLYWQEKA